MYINATYRPNYHFRSRLHKAIRSSFQTLCRNISESWHIFTYKFLDAAKVLRIASFCFVALHFIISVLSF